MQLAIKNKTYITIKLFNFNKITYEENLPSTTNSNVCVFLRPAMETTLSYTPESEYVNLSNLGRLFSLALPLKEFQHFNN